MGTKSASAPLGVAIVGLGRAGKIHLNVLHNRTDVKLLYLVDTSHAHGVQHDPKGATLTDDIRKPLNDERVQIVIVATPTQTHASLVLDALAAGKHVFAEKPLTCDETEIPTMFEMAAKQGRCLFTAFNRRHDPRILAAREKLRSGAMGKVFSATLVSRDYPYPPSAYIATCGNLFKDCVVHDLDYLLWILDDLPTHLIARASTSNDQRSMGAWENSEVRLTLGSGAQATLVNSRLSQSSYDHRLDVYCERGIVQVTNPLEQGLTFADRFDDSYHAQMGEFIERVRATDAGDCSQMTNMSHERTEYLNKLLNSCETSVATGSTILLAGDAALDTPTGPTVCRSTSSNASTRGEASEPDCGGLRVYDEDVTTDRVKVHYRTMRHKQSLAHVKRLRAKYDVLGTNRMGIWAALQALESYVDVSDPDVDLPNSAHCFQTAEGLRAAKQPDWLQLVGLIHDVGKMIFLRGCDEDGTSVAQQWSVVGDTFVVGCPLPDCTIFPAFNRLHPDAYDSPVGVYEPGCGLDQVYCAYGHDEYLYQVLSQNEGVKLPREAMYIIRYHSLYPWHEGGAYEELESPYDRSMKGWVKIFNQYDLYTKRNTPYTEGELAAMHTYYDGLIKKYLPEELAW